MIYLPQITTRITGFEETFTQRKCMQTTISVKSKQSAARDGEPYCEYKILAAIALHGFETKRLASYTPKHFLQLGLQSEFCRRIKCETRGFNHSER